MWERFEDRVRSEKEVVHRTPVKRLETTPAWKVEQFVHALDRIRGKSSQFITAIWPAEVHLLDVKRATRDRFNQAKNIEQAEDREVIGSSLREVLDFLEPFQDQRLENGFAFFVHIGKDARIFKFVVSPYPIRASEFVYSDHFITDIIWPHLRREVRYGLIVVSKREAAIGYIEGSNIVKLETLESPTLGETKKGGASTGRYQRYRDGLVHEHFKRVAEHVKERFWNRKLDGIVVGGPGDAKQMFCDREYLGTDLVSKIVGVLPTSDVREYGLSELGLRAKDLMK